MTETSKKRAEIVSSFRDHGTGEAFTAGDTPLIEVGAFINYEAAGLVRSPTTKPAPAAPRKAAAPAARKPAARKPAATPKTPLVPADPATAPHSGEGGGPSA